jgi:tRNA(Ile2)-agmatinylcytidine synthase
VIGATASIAWQGIHDSTFELIAYRRKERWGTERNIDVQTVKELDKQYPSTFDNYDWKHHHINILPNSPCPVLFGIRGDHAAKLFECMHIVHSEGFDDWLIFSSNQGTDDHLISASIQNVQPFRSVILTGMVEKKPCTIPGGHVIFSLRDNSGYQIDCAAYEPTKEFRDIIRQLELGDVVRVFGGVRAEPFTVNLEKIEILQLKEVWVKSENPVCPTCGKHMKSVGKNQGFRCKKCKTKADHAIMKKKERLIEESLYEVPVCARRHLSKPLKRLK